MVTTPAEAAKAYDALGGGLIVVKAQVHAGGRGKGVAVGPEIDRDLALEIASGTEAPARRRWPRACSSSSRPRRPQKAAASLLGKTLVTYQTGAAGPGDLQGAGHRRPRHRPRALPRPGDRPRPASARC